MRDEIMIDRATRDRLFEQRAAENFGAMECVTCGTMALVYVILGGLVTWLLPVVEEMRKKES